MAGCKKSGIVLGTRLSKSGRFTGASAVMATIAYRTHTGENVQTVV